MRRTSRQASGTGCSHIDASPAIRVRSAERLHRDEIADDREVASVSGEERDAVNVGRGRNREVDRSPAGLSAAFADGGGKSTPFPSDGGVDGERVDGCLDHAESLRSSRAFVGIRDYQRPEVELPERGDADRT